jgi:hypothetical protein
LDFSYDKKLNIVFNHAAAPEPLTSALGVLAMSKHPIHPVVRVAIWLLRWPLILSLILMGLGSGDRPHYAAPLQKQFYRPIFVMLWAVLALLPFVLIRRRIPFLIYSAAFCIIGGWLLYDLVVPFRFVAPDFHGVIEDPGGSYTIRGSSQQGYDYWITRFDSESWSFVVLCVWPFLLGLVYHILYVRGHRNA